MQAPASPPKRGRGAKGGGSQLSVASSRSIRNNCLKIFREKGRVRNKRQTNQ